MRRGMRCLVTLACAVILLSGCRLGTALGEAIGCALSAAFDFAYRAEGDLGNVRAQVDCRGEGDCADRRHIQQGAVLDFILEIPDEQVDGPLSIVSTDEDVVTVEWDAPMRDETCRYTLLVEGVARYHGLGEAAVVVRAGDEEIDRFTATVHAPAALQVQAARGVSLFGGGDFAPLEELTLDDVFTFRVRVLSADGQRLIGGQETPRWSVDDPDIVALGDDTGTTEGSTVVLVPQAAGETTLRVEVAGLTASLPLEATGAVDFGGRELQELLANPDGGVEAGAE